jgi:hypothetical protein
METQEQRKARIASEQEAIRQKASRGEFLPSGCAPPAPVPSNPVPLVRPKPMAPVVIVQPKPVDPPKPLPVFDVAAMPTPKPREPKKPPVAVKDISSRPAPTMKLDPQPKSDWIEKRNARLARTAAQRVVEARQSREGKKISSGTRVIPPPAPKPTPVVVAEPDTREKRVARAAAKVRQLRRY